MTGNELFVTAVLVIVVILVWAFSIATWPNDQDPPSGWV